MHRCSPTWQQERCACVQINNMCCVHDDGLQVWAVSADARLWLQVLYSMQRDTCTTNQRIAFDIEPCGRHLATGLPLSSWLATLSTERCQS